MKMPAVQIGVLSIAAMAAALFASPASAMRFSEVMYDAPGSDVGREWVEIENDGSGPVTLEAGSAGWRFWDGAKHVLNEPTQGSLTLSPGAFLVITSNPETFLAEHPGFSSTLIKVSFSLGNAAETIALLNSESATTATAFYDSVGGAAGNGRTLAWCDGAWRESSTDGGSPGAPNPCTIPLASPAPTATPSPAPTPVPTTPPTATPTPSTQPAAATASPTPVPTRVPTPMPTSAPTQPPFPDAVRINEFLPNAEGLDSAAEWIELYNAGSASADLSGWKLDDADGGSTPWAIPAGTVVAPNGYAAFSRGRTALALNNDADEVRLLTPQGQVYARVAYADAPRGASSARKADGSFAWTWAPTFGTENRFVAESVPTAEATPTPRASAVPTPHASAPVTTGEPRVVADTATTLPPVAVHEGEERTPAVAGAADSASGVAAQEGDRAEEAAAEQQAALAASSMPTSFFARNAMTLMVALAVVGGIAVVRLRRGLTQEPVSARAPEEEDEED